jgi:phosphoribosylglycinamide formyltransferase-1
VRRLGILISGRGSNFEAIARNIATGDLQAEIAVVISNRTDARGLESARALGIPTVCLPSKGVDRIAYDAMLVEELQKRNVELVCLAGFMRLLSSGFIRAFPNRILNIHPSLLPAFPGLDALSARILEQEHRIYSQAIARVLSGKFALAGRRVVFR